MAKSGRTIPIKGQQGFIDQHGNFHNRRAALEIAYSCGQLSHEEKTGNKNELFSEDLW